jgi:hypothetical protein
VINGPLNPDRPGDTPSRRRIFVCPPGARVQEEHVRAHDPAKLATRASAAPVSERDPTITR